MVTFHFAFCMFTRVYPPLSTHKKIGGKRGLDFTFSASVWSCHWKIESCLVEFTLKTLGYVGLKNIDQHNIYIWVNYNMLLTWILGPLKGIISLANHDSSEGEQWGRCNLPRYIYMYIYIIYIHILYIYIAKKKTGSDIPNIGYGLK